MAEKIGIPGDALTNTVARFNSHARAGRDPDFARGQSRYDHYYGDITNKPNPSLGELTKAPFYAAKMVPGDLGTKGGIDTDSSAHALRADGTVIEGLYAVGNTSAPVMGPMPAPAPPSAPRSSSATSQHSTQHVSDIG